MKVRIIQTTDGKYVGKEFVVDSLSPDAAKQVFGRDFDFQILKPRDDGTIELQSSHYTVILKIIE